MGSGGRHLQGPSPLTAVSDQGCSSGRGFPEFPNAGNRQNLFCKYSGIMENLLLAPHHQQDPAVPLYRLWLDVKIWLEGPVLLPWKIQRGWSLGQSMAVWSWKTERNFWSSWWNWAKWCHWSSSSVEAVVDQHGLHQKHAGSSMMLQVIDWHQSAVYFSTDGRTLNVYINISLLKARK